MKNNINRSCLLYTRGFSLVGMMVGVGILGALILGFMEFMRGSLQGQQKLMQVRELGDLKNEMGILLDSESHCRNSLAGEGVYGHPTNAVNFKKTDIDGVGADEEGLEVELYASNQDGDKRTEKMFSATDKKVNRYGSTLTIESIKLLMDTNDSTPQNYATNEDGHEDIGTLRIKVKTLDDNEQSFDIKLSVFMRTNDSGQSTLLSCSKDSSARRCGQEQKWNSKCGCLTPEQHTKAMQEGTDPDSSIDCQSFKCGENKEWNDQCGCVQKKEVVVNAIKAQIEEYKTTPIQGHGFARTLLGGGFAGNIQSINDENFPVLSGDNFAFVPEVCGYCYKLNVYGNFDSKPEVTGYSPMCRKCRPLCPPFSWENTGDSEGGIKWFESECSCKVWAKSLAGK